MNERIVTWDIGDGDELMPPPPSSYQERMTAVLFDAIKDARRLLARGQVSDAEAALICGVQTYGGMLCSPDETDQTGETT